MVLGTRWLTSLGALHMDFSTLMMASWCDGRRAQWEGVAGRRRSQ